MHLDSARLLRAAPPDQCGDQPGRRHRGDDPKAVRAKRRCSRASRLAEQCWRRPRQPISPSGDCRDLRQSQCQHRPTRRRQIAPTQAGKQRHRRHQRKRLARQQRRSSSRTSTTPAGSKPFAGSSRITSSGAWRNALARPSRWRFPVESVPARRDAPLVRSSAIVHRSAHASPGADRWMANRATSSPDALRQAEPSRLRRGPSATQWILFRDRYHVWPMSSFPW